jgi:hypothetical protein
MIPHFNKCFETLFVTRYGSGPPKATPTPMPQATSGMQVVTFGKTNVTHTYHSMDYADIYDPIGRSKKCYRQ